MTMSPCGVSKGIGIIARLFMIKLPNPPEALCIWREGK
jgi:hypothetical protein